MSAYSLVHGQLKFATEEGADKAREYLLEEKWLIKGEDDGKLRWLENDGGDPIPASGNIVVFNGGEQRNMVGAIEEILEHLEKFGYLKDGSSLRASSVDEGVMLWKLELEPAKEGGDGKYTGKLRPLEDEEIEEETGFDFDIHAAMFDGDEEEEEMGMYEEDKLEEWVYGA